MNKFYKLIITAGTAALITTSANAISGFSIGIIGNDSEFTTTGKEVEGVGDMGSGANNVNEESADTVSNGADFGSIFIEYSMGEDEGGGGLTVGVEYIPGEASLGTKSRTDTNGTGGANETDSDTGVYTGKAEVSDHWSIYAEPTFSVGNSWLGFYGKVGVSRVTVSALESFPDASNKSAYGNEDTFGAMYGAGIRISTPVGLFMKIEATETTYQTVTFQSGSGNKNTITGRPEQSSVRLALGYNF